MSPWAWSGVTRLMNKLSAQTRVSGLGRPVDANLSDRILIETLRLLAESGFHAMRIEDVAAACGTSKQAVYRRWKSKSELAAESVRFALERANPHVPHSGDVRRDLTSVLANTYRAWQETPLGYAIRALMAERRDADLAECMRAADEARRTVMRAILGRSRAPAEVELTIDLLLGGAWLHFLLYGSLPRTYAARVVDAILKP